MPSSPANPRLVLASLIAVQFLFGINYIVSKIVVGVFPPLVWASIRIAIATTIMLSVALISRRPHPKASLSYFGPMVIYALLGTIINQASFLVGLRYTTSTNSAILNTLIPIFTLLVVTVRGQEPLTRTKGIGFIFAFAGVLILRKVEQFSLSDQTFVGDMLMVLNCLSYALFLSYGKKFMVQHDPIWNTAWLFVYGTIGLTLLALPSYLEFTWPVMTPRLWYAASYAVIGATLMTYFLNFWALKYAKPSQVALFIYLQPVIAAGLGWYYFAESITLRTVLASGFIFLGMVLGLQKKAVPPA